MNDADAVLRAAPVLAQYGDGDPVILKAWLLRNGLSHEQAHDAMRFVPLAFAREILNGMGVALEDTYVRIVAGTREERPLANEPFFREAVRMIPHLDPSVVTTVAMQSSEFQAVNGALNAGADPANLVASPPVIECEVFETKKRPWWQFWT